MTIAQCGRDVPCVKSSVLLCSQVLSAISLEPTIICCAGYPFNYLLSIQFFTAADRKGNAQVELQCDGENRHVLDGSDVSSEVVWSFR